MKLSPTYSMQLKRRKNGKTDYKKRLALLKSGKPRLVARIKHNQVIAQVVKHGKKGDQVVTAATSLELKEKGWKKHLGNCSSAYLTGYLCGKRALEKGVKQCVLDTGLHTPVPQSNVFAVLKGALDAGLEVPHEEKCFPSEKRIDSKAIEETKKKLDSKKQKSKPVVKCKKKKKPKKKEEGKEGKKEEKKR
jgi:large subunit ribosomal protein L18